MATESLHGLLERVHWSILRPLGLHPGGDDRSLFLGQSVELSQVRQYQPGDDVRYMDWNATARTGGDPAYVREAQTPRALNVWLLIDVSPSMHWGTARCLKDDLSTDLVAVATELLGRHGNRVGALLFAERPLGFVPLGAGRTHRMRLMNSMRNAQRQDRSGPTSLDAVLRRLSAITRSPSLVLVVSDFLLPDDWQGMLRVLARRHEVVAITVTDPRERGLPDVGLITVEDPETGDQLTVNTGDRLLRERYARAAQAQALRLQRDLSRCGVPQLVIDTSEELLPQLLRFLELKRHQTAARAVLLRNPR